MQDNFILNLEDEIHEIESIILNYRNYESIYNRPGIIFSPLKRYPIEDKYNIGNLYDQSSLSTTPQLPIYGAEIVRDYLLMIHPSTQYHKLFKSNPMIGNKGINFLPNDNIDDILTHYCNKLSLDEIEHIKNILDCYVHDKLGCLDIPVSNIIEIEIDRPGVLIKVKEDICTFRMIEAGHLKEGSDNGY